MLKTLDLVMIHLLPVDLALLGLLTTLTTLRCECFLLEETQPLSRLASLSRLRQLDLTVVTAASGTQLPSSLSALTGLQTLQLRCRRNPLDWKSPAPRQQLPQAWCQAATQVTSVQLDHMDLPGIAGNRYSSNSGSRSWGNVIFPAMRDLHLVGPSDPCREALSRCQALKALKVEAADLGMAGWAALSALPQLGRLSVVHALLYEDADDDEGGQFFPVPGSLSALTSITFLHLRASAILPAIPQLPALQHECDVGSVEAVLRQATRLSKLVLKDCPCLKLKRDELPLLLGLPLKRLVLDKRPPYPDDSWPVPLWDEESLWVAEELRSALARRGPDLQVCICTEDSTSD
ncbi:hypothetical protein N2152v2_010505 [Parachlorella kessleri]